MPLGHVPEQSLVTTDLYNDLKLIEARLIEGIRLAEKHGLDVQAEILKEALLECQMQIDLVSQGRPPL
jgi:hypothetical protein